MGEPLALFLGLVLFTGSAATAWFLTRLKADERARTKRLRGLVDRHNETNQPEEREP